MDDVVAFWADNLNHTCNIVVDRLTKLKSPIVLGKQLYTCKSPYG